MKLRKIALVMLAASAVFGMYAIAAEPEQEVVEIPLKKVVDRPTLRGLSDTFIQCTYIGGISCVQTTVSGDYGEIDMVVTNCSNGEMWTDAFDTGHTCQSELFISGAPGLYEIVCTTESGDVFEGCFTIEMY